MSNIKKEWLGNIKGDLIAGIVVCMALIPEAIGFSIVAGVDPMIGVYASFTLSLVTSIFGGRPGLISAAAGSTALVLAGLVRSYGIEYMFAATILAGIIQAILGYFKFGNLMRFIPKPVMTGFVNALGILMFKSQLKHFEGGVILLILGALGIFIIYMLPRITKVIPAPIVSIITITIIVKVFNIDIKTLGDMGKITTDLPKLLIPSVPFNAETLSIILPYAVSVALVGIMESLLTSQLVDEMTDTPSNKNRECVGQGLGNIVTGFFGGIAGCGMIGQTIINITYGGRGRLSTLTAGTAMLFAIIILNKFVIDMPVVALASVMVVVAISTFNWGSLRRLSIVPLADTVVMIATVVIVLLTNNLAYGVVVGIIISSIAFVAKISDIKVEREEVEGNLVYKVKGQLFFVSTTKFINSFKYNDKVDSVCVDFSEARVWDESAVDAIDKVVVRYSKRKVKVKFKGLNKASAVLVERLSTYDRVKLD